MKRKAMETIVNKCNRDPRHRMGVVPTPTPVETNPIALHTKNTKNKSHKIRSQYINSIWNYHIMKNPHTMLSYELLSKLYNLLIQENGVPLLIP